MYTANLDSSKGLKSLQHLTHCSMSVCVDALDSTGWLIELQEYMKLRRLSGLKRTSKAKKLHRRLFMKVQKV